MTNCVDLADTQIVYVVGLQLRTALRTQFAESCVHAKESLKNYKPENSLLDNYCAEEEERLYASLYFAHPCIANISV